jgi:hypothetical protein
MGINWPIPRAANNAGDLHVTRFGNLEVQNLNVLDNMYGAGNLPWISGTWYYVDPTSGDSGYDGLTKDTAFDTIADAYDACTSGAGDGICLISRGTGTSAATTSYISTAIDWTKCGITVVGICAPTGIYNRARIANTTTVLTLVYLIDVQGHNNTFINVGMFNSGTDATALGCLKVTGQRNAFIGCHFVGGSCTTATANERSVELCTGAQDNSFYGCTLGTDTIARGNNANCELYLNGSAADGRNNFYGCNFLAYGTAAGAHVAIKSAGANAAGKHMKFVDCLFECFIVNRGANAASVFGGTGLDTKIFFTGTSAMLGYALWDAATANDCCFSTMPTAVAAGALATVAS